MASRAEHERDLARALSRQIGYTTGAYYLNRIAEITLEFEGRPNLVQVELLKSLKAKRHGSEGGGKVLKGDYASEILNFATSLGLVRRISWGGNPALNRFSLTSEGLSFRAAHSLGRTEYGRFLLTGLLLGKDADGYGLLLDVLATGPSDYKKAFWQQAQQIRQQRAEWINRAFHAPLLREHLIAGGRNHPSGEPSRPISWAKLGRLGNVKAEELQPSYGRHHATPRIGWAENIGHVANGVLTQSGADLVRSLRSGRSRYWWLGPLPECQSSLRIPEEYRETGPFSPAWDLMRPDIEPTDEPGEMFQAEVVQFMVESFPHLRFKSANQAPVDALLPYVHFLETQHGVRVQARPFFKRLFLANQSRFLVMSKRTGAMGYYGIRKPR